MFPNTMRWRLPLSYAAIALLAVMALGAVLLLTLRGYYAQRELSYLNGNARTIAEVVAMYAEARSSDWLAAVRESQLTGLSFLSQARVQVLDARAQVIADSGPAQPSAVSLAPFNEPLPPEAPLGMGTEVTAEVLITRSLPTIFYINSGIEGKRLNLAPPGNGRLRLRTTVISGAETTTATADILYTLPAFGTPFGFGLGDAVESDGRRSGQVVRYPFHGRSGALLGYVQLSEGPAYGGQVVDSVAGALALAGLVAVLLAAGVGLVISRRISAPLVALTQVTLRMAGGDLAARAAVARRDELGSLAASFNEMAGRVEGTILMLRRFIADAAHELNTPLTALRTNLELLADEPEASRRQAFIARAQAQVERLQTLTGGLLDLSRIESGLPQGSDALDLAALVRETSEAYASRAEQCGLAFSLDAPPQAVRVEGDRTQLRRAFGNLLDNALKFTPQDGAISVRLAQAEGWATLTVADTGIGIPAEDLPQLFNRFHRGRNAAAYPGSGLGLAIVKAIVEGHGGTVEALSAADGARFVVRLPLP